MSSLQLIDSTDKERSVQLKRHQAIEQGRVNALDLLVKGKPLHEVLNQLIFSLEQASNGVKCGIFLLDDDKQTLNPLVAPSFGDEFLMAFHQLPIGPYSCSSGASAFYKQPVYVEDVNCHPNWKNYRQQALMCGIRASWSYPIISPDGQLFGTFCMYLDEPAKPEQDDQDSLRYEAKIVSIILERARNIDQLKAANISLEQRVAERTQELSDANLLLRKALEQRNEVHEQLLEKENMAALGTMMSSLTHEINTPIGVGITAISYLNNLQKSIAEQLAANQLKRSDLEQFLKECAESCNIVERNLTRSTQLIKTFKRLSLDQHSQEVRKVNLCDYINEILLSLKPRLKRTKHTFCIDIDPALEINTNPGAVSQLLINLILNSAQHGFEPNEAGNIYIKARLDETINRLTIEYKDNGKGMSPHAIRNIYKPFFTMAKQSGGSGLGMHICYELVVKMLGGDIECESEEGKGVKFTVTLPMAEECPVLLRND